MLGGAIMILDRSGRYRIEYEDALRAIGHYLDVNLYRNVSIIELTEGLLAKGTAMRSAHRAVRLYSRTYLFKNDEIERILEDAYSRRGRGLATLPDAARVTLSNQDMLRVVGRVVDEEKWHDIVATQVPDGVRIKALVRPQTTAPEDDQVIDVFLSEVEIRRWVDELRTGRRPIRD